MTFCRLSNLLSVTASGLDLCTLCTCGPCCNARQRTRQDNSVHVCMFVRECGITASLSLRLPTLLNARKIALERYRRLYAVCCVLWKLFLRPASARPRGRCRIGELTKLPLDCPRSVPQTSTLRPPEETTYWRANFSRATRSSRGL